MKNRILVQNYYLPGDLERQIGVFVEHYNQVRYHESIDNVTPADVYFGRAQTILAERHRIKLATIPCAGGLFYLRGAISAASEDENPAGAGSSYVFARLG